MSSSIVPFDDTTGASHSFTPTNRPVTISRDALTAMVRAQLPKDTKSAMGTAIAREGCNPSRWIPTFERLRDSDQKLTLDLASWLNTIRANWPTDSEPPETLYELDDSDRFCAVNTALNYPLSREGQQRKSLWEAKYGKSSEGLLQPVAVTKHPRHSGLSFCPEGYTGAWERAVSEE